MWRDYFNQKATVHQGSVRSSDYFSEKSFLDQRRNLLAWLGPLHGARILDAGCGVGALSEELTSTNLVVGADLAETALGYARRRPRMAGQSSGRSTRAGPRRRTRSIWSWPAERRVQNVALGATRSARVTLGAL